MRHRRKLGAWSDTLGCRGSIPQRLPVVVFQWVVKMSDDTLSDDNWKKGWLGAGSDTLGCLGSIPKRLPVVGKDDVR